MDEAVSFPAFHERPTELTNADRLRIELADRLRTLIHDSFMSTTSEDDIRRAIVTLWRRRRDKILTKIFLTFVFKTLMTFEQSGFTFKRTLLAATRAELVLEFHLKSWSPILTKKVFVSAASIV